MSAASHIPSLPTDLAAQDFWAEAEALGRALVNQLEYLEALGVTEWPRSLLPPPPPPTPALPPPPRPTRPAAVSGRRPAAPDPAPFPRDGGDLPAWRLQLAACQACTLAQGGGEAPAAGRGAEKPLLVVVGPDPSIHGGATGELLINMVEKGLSLTPDEYYLTALVKCRPPEGTEPSPEAVAACRPILQRELSLLGPPIVLALGELTGRHLSGRLTEPLGLLRPRSHRLEGLPGAWLRVTYDLDHLAGSVALKREAWKDLQKIRLGLEKLPKLPK